MRQPKTHKFIILLCLAFASLSTSALADEAKGMLRVRSDQGSATVYLGTDIVGTTPHSAHILAGTYTVRVLKDGFEPFVRRIQIQPGRATDVTARLFPGKGSVEFLIEPAGATLSIDGNKETYSTPVRLRDLLPGAYEFTLTAPGHEDDRGTFDFRQGQNLLISSAMMSSAGLVSINTQPSGATVYLDGENVGLTPVELEDIPGGKHTVQVMKKGYASIFRRFDTTDGSKGEIEARLPRSGVPLSVATGDTESELTIEGMHLGPQKSFRFGPVERGRYELIISAPDMKTIEQSVNVPATGTALYRARLRPADGEAPSTLTRNPPFYKHWLFWTAVGGGAASGTALMLVNMQKNKPKTIPAGDVLIRLP